MAKQPTTKRKYARSALCSVQDFLSLVSAVHLSSYVDSPFKDRGGLMIVGPPGALKTTCVNFLDDSFSDALILSDLNVQSLVKIKERVAGNSIRTLVLSEMGKLYERNPQVASNAEGTLRALAGEGFSSASFEDATISRQKARATIIGAMTGSLRDRYASRWDDSGFGRRFLWALVSLENPAALDRAVIDGNLLDIAITEAPRIPLSGVIPNYSSREERQIISGWCKYQPSPHTVQISVLIKAWAVLKWWARQQRRSEDMAFKTLHRAAAAFGRNGVELVIS
jgi:hypothetical protein